MHLQDLTATTKVKFGTSGARGLAADMTDWVCYAYTAAFLQFLEETGQAKAGMDVAVAGDLRESTDRIMGAVSRTITDRGYTLDYCGKIPTPALTYYGLLKTRPAIMVTGSHIPGDRNGIKFTKQEGEILKADEACILAQDIDLPEDIFDLQGMLKEPFALPYPHDRAQDLYVRRYTDFFGSSCLAGVNIGLYAHSAVGRDLTQTILESLGATVTPLGRSEEFIPVDTEAIRAEDRELAQKWSAVYGFDAIVSTDGDGDRPLISDECGNWLRGDVAGILCAKYVQADAVVVPVSSNTALEKSGLFPAVYRTRIGSPYVIAGMQQAEQDGYTRIVGYEANGGFLTQSELDLKDRKLLPLPTRDPLIVIISLLAQAKQQQVPLSSLLNTLPKRYTASDRLTSFPVTTSHKVLDYFSTQDEQTNRSRIEEIFGPHFGHVDAVNQTDGLRIIFDTQEIVHLRPSGNAPEFRCYTEAGRPERAQEMNEVCLGVIESWRDAD
ncbi:MAG: phosphomannomutase [Desulfovermiculus sp.]|nr:phosphomannomutase [Desulfovermiculus sp.]